MWNVCLIPRLDVSPLTSLLLAADLITNVLPYQLIDLSMARVRGACLTMEAKTS